VLGAAAVIRAGDLAHESSSNLFEARQEKKGWCLAKDSTAPTIFCVKSVFSK
jgi:hypothetical protein